MVEDDVSSALSHKVLLERAKMNVVAAVNGRVALDVLDADAGAGIEVVLMDIRTPEMDGYEAMAAIREGPRPRLPIIAVSAKDAGGERERCLVAGASDFIPKPIGVPILLSAIEMWTDQSAAERSVRW